MPGKRRTYDAAACFVGGCAATAVLMAWWQRRKGAAAGPTPAGTATDTAADGESGFLLLSDADVRAALPMADAIEVNERAFIEMHTKRAVVPERHILMIADGATLFKPASLPHSSDGGGAALGLKVVSTRPSNSGRGLPTVPATVLMFDEATGLPSALIEATWLTALRTAAGSAAATRRLARANARVLAVLGAGLQAEAHVEAMLCVRPSLRVLLIANRSAPRAERLAAACRARYPQLERVGVVALGGAAGTAAAAELEAAVRAAHIICTCTNASSPLFRADWLTRGVHINGVGSYTPQMEEVPAGALGGFGAVVIDSEHAMEVGDLARISRAQCSEPAARPQSAPTVCELGALLHDEVQLPCAGGRQGASTFFKSVGVAVQDVATGAAVVRGARSRGVGRRVQF